jgi:arylsulfatase A-like enzyme
MRGVALTRGHGGPSLRRRWLVSLAVVLVAVAPGCRPLVAPAPRGNLILISVDTLRADHLGCYGYQRPTSPNIDRLATGGVLFEHAEAQAPWTLPSHATMLTGLLPARHGMLDDGRRLPSGIPTLAESLQQAGFRTAGFVNVVHLAPSFGFARGFDTYTVEPTHAGQIQTVSAGRVGGAIQVWIDEHRDEPFFVFFHTFDVHTDYRPAETFQKAFVGPYHGTLEGTSRALREASAGGRAFGPDDIAHVRDLYDAGIRQLDENLRGLLDFLDRSGLAKETFVVLTSDHGEEFGEHGRFLHGHSLHDELLHVPLIIRGPGIPSGVRVPERVGLVDLVPTLQALLGVPPFAVSDGRDLAPLWRGTGDAAPRPVFAETDRHTRLRDSTPHLVSVTLGSHKLIRDLTHDRSTLYDLDADPGELDDRAAAEPATVARLQHWIDGYLVLRLGGAPDRTLTDDQLEQLRALGYAE